jgi:aspartyl/glutamyl-tRNA(Asn/Gln) amidotransferase C subunit
MAISDKEINRLLTLSALRCEGDALEKLRLDVENFENRLSVLDGVDAFSVSKPQTGITVLRPDTVGDGTEREAVLKNAEKTEDGCFVVPRVVE